jgi:hypothetical protein
LGALDPTTDIIDIFYCDTFYADYNNDNLVDCR